MKCLLHYCVKVAHDEMSMCIAWSMYEIGSLIKIQESVNTSSLFFSSITLLYFQSDYEMCTGMQGILKISH